MYSKLFYRLSVFYNRHKYYLAANFITHIFSSEAEYKRFQVCYSVKKKRFHYLLRRIGTINCLQYCAKMACEELLNTNYIVYYTMYNKK